MLTRKEIEERQYNLMQLRNCSAHSMTCVVADQGVQVTYDALAKHDALLEIYHLLGGEGEPEDLIFEVKERVAHLMRHRFQPICKEEGVVKLSGDQT